MKGEIIRTITSDGIRLDGILCEPTASWKGDSVSVLYIHGMGGNFYENKFIDPISQTVTKHGMYFCTVNTRGAGIITDFELVGKREKIITIGQQFEKLTDCTIDVATWVDFLQAKGIKKIILSGHSLGCVKVILYYLKLKDKNIVNKIMLLSPPDMIGLIEREDEIINHKLRLKEAKKLIKDGKSSAILKQKLWEEYQMCATSYVDYFETYKPLNVFPLHQEGKLDKISTIEIPILVAFGQFDHIAITTIKADAKVYQQSLTNTKSNVVIIPQANHDYHKNADILADEIGKFFKK